MRPLALPRDTTLPALRQAGAAYHCPAEREKLAYEAQDKWLHLFGRNLEAELSAVPHLAAAHAAAANRRNLNPPIKRLSNHDTARRYRSGPGLAVNPCDVCLIETDGKTTKRLRDREISRPQSRSSFQKRTCLRWREAQSRKHDEDHIPSGGATACVIFRDPSHDCANQQKRQSSACRHSPGSWQATAGIQDRRPRDRSSALELRLHERPRPTTM